MRTQKQIAANYTELVHAGEGIEIEKGRISATGGSGGSQPLIVTADWSDSDNGIVIDVLPVDVYNAFDAGRIVMVKDVEADGGDAKPTIAGYKHGWIMDGEGELGLSTLQSYSGENGITFTCRSYVLTGNNYLITRSARTITITQ